MVVPLTYELKKAEIYDHFRLLFSFYRECLFIFFLTIGLKARATGGLTDHTHSTTNGFQAAGSMGSSKFL